MKHYIITVFCNGYNPQSYDLEDFQKQEVLLGRGPWHGNTGGRQNDIVVPQEIGVVSRAHGIFRKYASNWYIFDENSMNGIIINGRKISRAELTEGMQIYIGDENKLACVISVSSRQENIDTFQADVGAQMFSLLEKSKCIIGRNSSCDIVVSHPSASRFHAVIERTAKGFVLSDNHSVNGININGRPLLGPTVLKDMDRFTIADMTLIFCEGNLYSTVSKGGVGIRTVDLCKEVTAKSGRKLITNHVNLTIDPGEFVAIIGGSGAGKTTLLNCLSGVAGFTSGEVLINNDAVSSGMKALKGIIGYVPQKDIVYDDLTLERMLYYSAELRMPKETTKEEIRRKIDETLEIVDLKAHRETMIGKLSGGQKKRASIAVELLADPKLFFLDEPFSGLDPGVEKKMMKILKRIADTGHTVIMVTHSVLYLSMCSRVVCMGRGGYLCYSGRPDKLCETFGVRTVADVFDELDNNAEEWHRQRMRESVSAYTAEDLNATVAISKETPRKARKNRISFRQFRILTARYAELCVNRRSRLILLLLMPVILTFFVCAAFQMDGGLSNVIYNLAEKIPFLSVSSAILTKNSHPFLVVADTESALLTFACAAFWIGMFNSIQEISKERSICQREAFTGVRSLPYVGSKMVVSTVLCIFQSAVMTAILMWLANSVETINGDVTACTALTISLPIEGATGGVVFENALWLELYITTLLTMLSAMCLGLLVSSIFSNDMALVICPIALLPQILFSNIISQLTGIAETVSNIISCQWSVRSYCTSVGVYGMLSSIEYETGTWKEGDVLKDVRYCVDTKPLLGLSPVGSSWLVLGLLCIACILGAIFALYLRSKGDYSLLNQLRYRKANKSRNRKNRKK